MARNKIRLGINIDHIATIKTNRKTSYPSLIEAVKIAEDSGADLITVHLREDRRHIQDQDLKDIKSVAQNLNLEMALTEEMLGICLQTKPNFCCIVPERREELTTEGGLDINGMTKNICARCSCHGTFSAVAPSIETTANLHFIAISNIECSHP